MNTYKMMLISISFVFGWNIIFLKQRIKHLVCSIQHCCKLNHWGDDETNTVGDNNNSEQQNYDDFQNCLEDEAGTSGFATEDQIRDCFAPIYIGSSDDDSSSDDDN